MEYYKLVMEYYVQLCSILRITQNYVTYAAFEVYLLSVIATWSKTSSVQSDWIDSIICGPTRKYGIWTSIVPVRTPSVSIETWLNDFCVVVLSTTHVIWKHVEVSELIGVYEVDRFCKVGSCENVLFSLSQLESA